jgi:hypothetical protein
MSNFLFISGPYRAPNAQGVAENVRRACELGAYACRCGLLPIVPHAQGFMGCFGAVSDGVSDDEETEQAALNWGCKMASHVGSTYGTLWVILTEEGKRSFGTDLECQAFLRSNGDVLSIKEGKWSFWKDIMERGVRP